MPLPPMRPPTMQPGLMAGEGMPSFFDIMGGGQSIPNINPAAVQFAQFLMNQPGGFPGMQPGGMPPTYGTSFGFGVPLGLPTPPLSAPVEIPGAIPPPLVTGGGGYTSGDRADRSK